MVAKPGTDSLGLNELAAGSLVAESCDAIDGGHPITL